MHVNTRKYKLIGFSLSQMLGLPSLKESEQTYASPTLTYLTFKFKLLSYHHSMTLSNFNDSYSNCASSLKNALITGLWFYIVYLPNSPF